MTKTLITLALLFFTSAAFAESDSCVVLIHGHARTPQSMKPLKKFLESKNYHVVNIGYPSRKFSIPKLSQMVFEKASLQTLSCENIHFVTHSMGGILVRYGLKAFHLPINLKTQHVVMLAPPNHGSAIVDSLRHYKPFQNYGGPALMALSTDSKLLRRLGPVNFSLGVIAGNKSLLDPMSVFLEGPNDGKVTVASTFVSGLRDHEVLPLSHTFIINSPEVYNYIYSYLKFGFFKNR